MVGKCRARDGVDVPVEGGRKAEPVVELEGACFLREVLGHGNVRVISDFETERYKAE